MRSAARGVEHATVQSRRDDSARIYSAQLRRPKFQSGSDAGSPPAASRRSRSLRRNTKQKTRNIERSAGKPRTHSNGRATNADQSSRRTTTNPTPAYATRSPSSREPLIPAWRASINTWCRPASPNGLDQKRRPNSPGHRAPHRHWLPRSAIVQSRADLRNMRQRDVRLSLLHPRTTSHVTGWNPPGSSSCSGSAASRSSSADLVIGKVG